MSDQWWPDGYANPAFQVQRQEYGTAIGGDYVRARPGYKEPAYLNALVGTVSTPDPGVLPTQCTLVCKVRGPNITGADSNHVIACQWGASALSWMIDRSESQGYGVMFASPDGTATNVCSVDTGATSSRTSDEMLAFSLQFALTTTQRFRSWRYANDTWTPIAYATSGVAAGGAFESTGLVIVGKSGFNVDMFDGRIYSVELRTGLDPNAGTVVWRFDASEYPGTGTSYVDPRGRTWTLTNASAIVPPTAPAGLTTLPQTSLRYPTAKKGYDLVRNRGYLTIRPYHDYVTAEIAWGWPVGVTEDWLEVALVRSGFGDPVTVNDGETVMYGNRAAFTENAELIPPPIVYDRPLQSGHWYYYTLFFKTTPLDWVRATSGSVLIPRNYRHAEHLWDAVPPFYQSTDSNLREGNGPLRQFLTVFGFELDQTRAYVESWQETYHVDTSPMALLKRVGENFGEPFAAGIGAIRYRGLLAALPEALSMRGTTAALQQIIEAASKYDCDISVGGNLLLLPDDSDFYYGTGSWAALHPGTTGYPNPHVLPASVFMSPATSAMQTPPTNAGRGVMIVKTTKAQATTDLVLTNGDGQNSERDIVPLYAAVPVEPNSTYGFSVQVKMQNPSAVVLEILWFGEGGQPANYLSATTGASSAPANSTTWFPYQVQGSAPAGAIYMVPTIRVTNRIAGADPTYSPNLYLAGAMVYLLAAGGEVTVPPPDSYLTMGDPSEMLGALDSAGHPAFKPFILGTGDR